MSNDLAQQYDDDDGDVIVTKLRSLIFGIRARQFKFPWTWFAGHSIWFHFSESMRGRKIESIEHSTKCQFSVNSLLPSRAINAHIPTVDGTRSNLNQSVSLMIIIFCAKNSFVTNEESNKAMDKRWPNRRTWSSLIELCVELNGTSQHIPSMYGVCARACTLNK